MGGKHKTEKRFHSTDDEFIEKAYPGEEIRQAENREKKCLGTKSLELIAS